MSRTGFVEHDAIADEVREQAGQCGQPAADGGRFELLSFAHDGLPSDDGAMIGVS